jgi:hypothetical protein
MARRIVPTARPVSALSSVRDGSRDFICPKMIRSRRWAASCRYTGSDELWSILTVLLMLCRPADTQARRFASRLYLAWTACQINHVGIREPVTERLGLAVWR